MEGEWNKNIIYLIIGVVIAGIFVLGSYFYFSTQNQDVTYIDQASGAIVYKEETGGDGGEGPGYIGATETIDLEVMNTFAFQKSLSVIKQYFTIVYSDIEFLSFVKNSSERVDDGVSFSLRGDNGQEFVVKLDNIYSPDYKIEVFDTNNLVYSYSPIIVKLDPAILAKNYLPYHAKLDDDTEVILFQKTNGDIELAVDACGNQEIIKAAKEKINNWLYLRGFDPNDFSFSIPTYCDKGH